MTTAIAELLDLTVTYPDAQDHVVALDAVSCTFAKGSSTAIVGRSGSGKSTLVSVLSLLRRATYGELQFDGQPTSTMSDGQRADLRRRIGVVFQSFHVDVRETALANVMLPFHWQPQLPRSGARGLALQALDMLGIGNLASRRVSDMSGGQRQRVAVARAVAFAPQVLIADEPTGNLDEETADGVARDLVRVASEVGSTLILVTHDVHLAAMTERTLHMQAGRLEVSS